MVLEVPTVQLESNAPPMLQGGSIQQMTDEKGQALQQMAKGQMQFGQQISDIAQKLQAERDDAVYTQKHNEFIAKVNETKLNYASYEGENAIKIVGYDDNDQPITVLDQTKADLTKLSEEFEASLENDTQKLLFKTKAASTLNSANMFMTKHEITEFQTYRDNEFLNEIDIIADTTGQNYEDWHDGSGEFSKHKAISLLLASRYADNKGWPENSSQRAGLIQKVINKINVSTLNQMIAKKDFDDAKAYLDSETDAGRVDAATYNTYASKILTGYNKQKGEIKANAVFTDRGDTNSGSFPDKANKLFSLDSFNHTDDGTGRTVKYGFRPDEIDTSQLNESDAKEFLEQVQNTSKYYQEDSSLRLIPQHQTIHLFVGKHLGIKKADSYFSKAKKELVAEGIDLERIKNDPTYANEFNAKLIDKVIGYTNEDMVNKIGADNPFATMVANDLQILKSDINYEYDPNDGPSYKVDEKTKMPLLADLKKKLKNTIQDEDQLTYALAELERIYKDEKEGKEEIYDANLEAAKEIAYSDRDGWTKLADNGIDIEDFTREDQLLLRNGHSEKSDTNTILFLDKNPEVVADINELNKYRGKLTQSDYLEYVEESKKLQAGGSGSVVEAKVDADIFDTALKDYGFEKLLQDTGVGSDYRDVRLAVKEEINKRQIQKGSKLTFKEKQDAVGFVLNDKVLMQGKGRQIFPLGAVDDDEYKKAYVKVNNKKVFLRAINDYQREQIVKSFIDAGKGRPTEQQIAEYWVRNGMPRDDGKGSKTPVYNKNGDIEASDTGNTRKYVQTFNIMG